MEHRCSQRLKSDSQVMIYERSIPVATGHLANSNRYGFFIETHHAAKRRTSRWPGSSSPMRPKAEISGE